MAAFLCVVWRHGGAGGKTGMVRFNRTMSGAPSNMGVQSEIRHLGKIIFYGRGLIGTGNKIRTNIGAILSFGDNFKVTDMCNISCDTEISIGKGSWVVHRCQILDTNFHFVADFGRGVLKPQAWPIRIGDYCWICNSSTVTAGAVVPDHCIVASNSLVNRDCSECPPGALLGGVPARLLGCGFCRILNPEVEWDIFRFYKQHGRVDYPCSHLTYDDCVKF